MAPARWNRLIGSSRDFQRVPDIRKAPPPVTSVSALEVLGHQPDGTADYGILVTWVDPTYYGVTAVDIWYQDSSAGTAEWMYAGRSKRSPFHVLPLGMVAGETYRIAVATVSALEATDGPDDSPQTTITLRGEDPKPPTVAGFAVADLGASLLFSWTPVSSDLSFVMGYELRYGSTGWTSATAIGKVGPRNTPFWPVPRHLAPGTSFYLKAVSYAEVYSATVSTATLAAADETSVDAASPGTYYQEVDVTAGNQSQTVTTKGQFSAAPILTVAGNVAGLDGSFDGTTFAQNGDGTWSATAYLDDPAPTGGGLLGVIEAGPRQ